jgi:hypothetical protein
MMSDIPQEAIDAGTRTIHEARVLEYDAETVAFQVIAAALPFLRAQWEDELTRRLFPIDEF